MGENRIHNHEIIYYHTKTQNTTRYTLSMPCLERETSTIAVGGGAPWFGPERLLAHLWLQYLVLPAHMTGIGRELTSRFWNRIKLWIKCQEQRSLALQGQRHGLLLGIWAILHELRRTSPLSLCDIR